MVSVMCAEDGCDRGAAHRGLCKRHYQIGRRSGALELLTIEDRFFLKVEKSETCWLWTGVKSRDGYGRIYAPVGTVRMRPAHRVAYELFRGPIADGLDVDHLCRVRACVNPDHLEPVTRTENIVRGELGAARRAGRCSNGHDLTAPGALATYRRGSGTQTKCRACDRERSARRRSRAKEESK